MRKFKKPKRLRPQSENLKWCYASRSWDFISDFSIFSFFCEYVMNHSDSWHYHHLRPISLCLRSCKNTFMVIRWPRNLVILPSKPIFLRSVDSVTRKIASTLFKQREIAKVELKREILRYRWSTFLVSWKGRYFNFKRKYKNQKGYSTDWEVPACSWVHQCRESAIFIIKISTKYIKSKSFYFLENHFLKIGWFWGGPSKPLKYHSGEHLRFGTPQ